MDDVLAYILRYINYVLVVCAVLAIIYDFVQKIWHGDRHRAAMERLQIDLILFLIATYVLTTTIRLDQIEGSALPLPKNAFDQSLRFHIGDIERGIKKQEITFSTRHEALAELLRVVDTAEESYEALNLFTTGWDEEMKGIYEASAGAVDRKIEVSRCFVIRDAYGPGEYQAQLDAMKSQHDADIAVYYVMESDLKKLTHFRRQPVRSMALVDKKLLVIDTSPSYEDRGITEIRVTWNAEEVADNPFVHLRNLDYMKKFDPEKLKEIEVLR